MDKHVKLKYIQRIDEKLLELPWFVTEYIDSRKRKVTINRKLSSLNSLFDYLQNKAETPDLKPYLQRNVMAKIELNTVKESQETIANRIEGKILRDDDFESFRRFIAHDYGEIFKTNKRIHNFHQFNRERDTAIVSLILGSGLR